MAKYIITGAMPGISPRSWAATVLVLGLLLGGCRGRQPLAPTASPLSSRATASDPASAATPAPTPSPGPTPTEALTPPPACLDFPGRILQTELSEPGLPRSIPYRVFVPPCAESARGGLPLLVLLHGLARTDSEWDELGVDELAQSWIASGAVRPFLIVMPWERLGLEYESAIIEHLLPFLERSYGASPDPNLRAIGGISRGGGWALRIGLKHPDEFGTIGLHSPAVLVPDLFRLDEWIRAIPAENLPAVWIDMGERDSMRFELAELTEALDELGLAYSLNRFPGDHSEAYWAAHVAEYLKWYVLGWQPATPDPEAAG
jgi:acetyl esterase/lipase